MSPTRRSGFTLMELLAVMLLIITVMAMGVPAMFAAERKSYVNQAMGELINVHQACMSMQRELAARGDPSIVTLTINTGAVSGVPAPSVSVSAGSIDAAQWFGRSFPISINADEFVTRIDSTGGLSWSYAQQTGFINSASPITLSFRALPSGANFKVNRDLTLYPQGYSEVP